MLVPSDSFDKLMNFFANACTLNGLSNYITRVFLQFLEGQKEHLVESEKKEAIDDPKTNSSSSLMEALD